MTYDKQMRIAVAEAQGWTGPWRFGNVHLHGTPPNADKPATDWTNDKHVPEKVDALVQALCNKITTLSAGIKSVRGLMNESQGVAGLHLNGTIATWEDLGEKGRSWEWIFAFHEAEREVPNEGAFLLQQQKEK